VYLLRYDGQADEWTLQSGFDGDELLAKSARIAPTSERRADARKKKRGQKTAPSGAERAG